MPQPAGSEAVDAPPAPPTRFQRITRKLWWLHSAWALSFGVGVMIFARKGLAYADKLLLILAASWLLVFLALRFISGPTNTRPDDRLAKRGVRLVTNYVIKNLYQQMFFFLVPLYASSATWALGSPNWWLPPLLLVCAVLSTLDLVMDHFVMQRRPLAAALYGVCFFGVLNLMLPLAARLTHFESLLVAAALAAPAVALLTFPLRTVFTARGVLAVVLASAVLVGGAAWHPEAIPPAPLALSAAGVGHGQEGAYELVPGAPGRIGRGELDRLRCASLLSNPGGLPDDVVHVWRHDGAEWARIAPASVDSGGRLKGFLLRSYLTELPADPTGRWVCSIETAEGQLVGRVEFRVVD